MSQKNYVYADLNNDFKINDYTGDVVRKFDADAVKQSLSNLLRTKHYDRCFHPEIGAYIEQVLFQPASSFYLEAVKVEMENLIRNYEPRVNIIELSIVQDKYEPSLVRIKMTYEIISIGVIDTYEFKIQRVL